MLKAVLKITFLFSALIISILACGGSSSTSAPTEPPVPAETDEPEMEELNLPNLNQNPAIRQSHHQL
ncbi:MAG: hypothetical protein FVQ83_13655 [Chloroflexi bacterium]|nr:hypothetical protein [Chloroflexota bacterium]